MDYLLFPQVFLSVGVFIFYSWRLNRRQRYYDVSSSALHSNSLSYASLNVVLLHCCVFFFLLSNSYTSKLQGSRVLSASLMLLELSNVYWFKDKSMTCEFKCYSFNGLQERSIIFLLHELPISYFQQQPALLLAVNPPWGMKHVNT